MSAVAAGTMRRAALEDMRIPLRKSDSKGLSTRLEISCQLQPETVRAWFEMTSTRTTPRDLRRANRAAVLRPLLLEGPQYRLGLARRTGLSTATMTNVVGELLAEGLVVEVGVEESDGGR